MTDSKKSTKPPSLDDIPELLLTIEKEKGEKSAAAIKRIYELCDVGHKQNRVPMVCSGKWDVLTPLAACLTQESGDGRQLACLALNNLSIPTENKRVMALGPAAKDVIGGLCNIIAEDKKESYLCYICLMNLSFLQASITTIFQHSPVADGAVPVKALENPDSLIRVLEKLLSNSSSTPKSGSGRPAGVRRACDFFKNLTKSEDNAGKSQRLQWACALIKKLAKSEDNAKLLGKTNIPMCVAMIESKKSTKPPPLDDIPELLLTIEKEKGEKSAAAVKRIYELCDVGHKQNRVPMVCSGKWDVLTPLAACLTQESGDRRHLACLALNNLSIPTENKRVMALGPAAKDVIGGLCNIIAEDKQYAYLCCICLMNLSFLDEASITTILQHSPVADGAVPVKALENPDSLIRVLEKLLSNSSSTPKSGSGKTAGVRRACDFFKNLAKSEDNAGKSVRLRWACGLIKNLAKSEDNAKLLGKTNIPMCVVDNLRNANTSPNCWTSNSLEDFSLFVILNLAQWDASKDALIDAGAVEVIKPIMNEGDLQGLKATMACAFLEASWSDFPDGGQSANKSVSELMTNIVEKKGKDGQYAYGFFKLYTSTKAFRDLCLSAKKVEANSPMATPSSVALCFQIVSDLLLTATDEAEGGSKYVPDAMSAESSNYVPDAISAEYSKYVPDAMSAEYSVQSIEAMLPTILAKEQYHRSVQSEKAAAEIVNMLYAYANVSGTSSKAQASARNSAEQIKSVSGNAGQILEIAHDLWTQYRKREGQPSDQFIN
jgi:hypothetical protein